MGKQLELFEDEKLSPKYWNVPFVDEVQEFNQTFGKPNNYEPTIPEKNEWMLETKYNIGKKKEVE